MLARKYRLTGQKNFDRVETNGEMYQSKNFGIAYLDRGDGGDPRFAFVVSTKISKEAVDRNTIKRHISETVRLMVGEVKRGYDVVFLAKTGIMRIPADEIVREVRTAIRASGIVI